MRPDNSQQSTLVVNVAKPININLTESCLTNLIETYYSWMETPPYQFDEYQVLKEQAKIAKLKSTGGGAGSDKNNNTGSINDEPKIKEEDEDDESDMSEKDVKEAT